MAVNRVEHFIFFSLNFTLNGTISIDSCYYNVQGNIARFNGAMRALSRNAWGFTQKRTILLFYSVEFHAQPLAV